MLCYSNGTDKNAVYSHGPLNLVTLEGCGTVQRQLGGGETPTRNMNETH